MRRAYWQDYAVLERLGLFLPDTHAGPSDPNGTDPGGGSVGGGGLGDHLLALAAGDTAQQGRGGGDEAGLGGPFGGTVGDGMNRYAGSWATLPAPAVVPTYTAARAPVVGERWDLMQLAAGFSPAHGP